MKAKLTRQKARRDIIIVLALIWHCFVIVMALFFELLISRHVSFMPFLKTAPIGMLPSARVKVESVKKNKGSISLRM